MIRYIVPRIFCAVGTLVIFSGVFLSGLNITLGNILVSSGIAIGITSVVLLLVILAYYMKKTDNMLKLYIYNKFEFFGVLLFAIFGLASLLVFNHCITVWLQTGEIQKNLNIRQLEKLLPEYEKYANQRIADYKNQLNNAILYRNYRRQELITLGFNTNSSETLESQKVRKIEKLKQVLRPHIYKNLTDTITASIAEFVDIVEEFSPITAPKNINRIEGWVKHYENQLKSFSHYNMKGKNTDVFQFESTFGNVKEILTDWDKDFFSPKRFLGYGIGLVSLIFMFFPYLKVKRSNKLNE